MINGVTVTMAAASTLDISVSSISNTTNVWVLGEPINTRDGSPIRIGAFVRRGARDHGGHYGLRQGNFIGQCLT